MPVLAHISPRRIPSGKVPFDGKAGNLSKRPRRPELHGSGDSRNGTSRAFHGNRTTLQIVLKNICAFSERTPPRRRFSSGDKPIAEASGHFGGIAHSKFPASYDTAGNVLSDGTNTFTYNNAGRLASSANSAGTTTYTYNVLGQRVRKFGPNGTTYFIYDEQGHLLGEYDGNVNLLQEIVWLGDIPVASIRPGQNGGVGIFYIHTDSLNAPARLTRTNDNTVVWRWDHDPYGNGAAMIRKPA
jgi:YD repeat-containing protein